MIMNEKKLNKDVIKLEERDYKYSGIKWKKIILSRHIVQSPYILTFKSEWSGI